jgi:hypothetical protein
MDGYKPEEVKIMRKASAGFIVMDIIFGVVPLLFDAAVGTLHKPRPNTVNYHLERENPFTQRDFQPGQSILFTSEKYNNMQAKITHTLPHGLQVEFFTSQNITTPVSLLVPYNQVLGLVNNTSSNTATPAPANNETNTSSSESESSTSTQTSTTTTTESVPVVSTADNGNPQDQLPSNEGYRVGDKVIFSHKKYKNMVAQITQMLPNGVRVKFNTPQNPIEPIRLFVPYEKISGKVQ